MSRGVTIAVFLALLTLIPCAMARAEGQPQAGGVTVILGTDLGEPLYRASGFLHGFTDDGLVPPDAAVTGVKMRLHRSRPNATWKQAARLKGLGVVQQVVISDGWGYGKEHPGDNGNWEKWETFVARMVTEAKTRGLDPQWDIWNEPDHKFFWQRTPEQFLETWKRGYRKIREVAPDAVIVGPSWSAIRPGHPRFTGFVLYAKANKVVPDYLCWHFPKDMVAEVREARALVAREGLTLKGIAINEYTLKEQQYAGRTAWLIAQIERAGVDESCHAIWGDEGKGSLDGVLFDAKAGTPKGQWWAYERYARITGRLVETVPSDKIDLVAGKDEKTRTARVLLGNVGKFDGDLKVRFTGLAQAPYLVGDGRVRVLVEMIPENKGQFVQDLPIVSDQTVEVKDGAVEVTIPWTSDRDAYSICLSRGWYNISRRSGIQQTSDRDAYAILLSPPQAK